MAGVLMPARRDTGLLSTVLKGLAIAKDVYGIYTDSKQNELAEEQRKVAQAEKDRDIANEPVAMAQAGMVPAQEGETGAVAHTGANGKKSWWKKAAAPGKPRSVTRQIANVNQGGKRGTLTTWSDGTQEFTPTMDPQPAPQRPTLITTMGPDGQPIQEAVVLVPGQTYGKPPKEPSESEATSARHAKNAMEADQQLAEMEKAGYQPATWGAKASQMPLIGRMISSEDDQMYNNAKRAFVAAVLRKDTGAAVSDKEFEFYDELYFPQPNDTEKTIATKGERRAGAIESLVASAGQRAQAQQGLATGGGTKGPKVGTVEDGHEFLGGDPSDPKNWKPVTVSK